MGVGTQVLLSLALVVLAGVALLPGRRPPSGSRRHPRAARTGQSRR